MPRKVNRHKCWKKSHHGSFESCDGTLFFGYPQPRSGATIRIDGAARGEAELAHGSLLASVLTVAYLKDAEHGHVF